ncbi:MAG: hypothetical protein WCY36_08005, partial [Candidatus Omnitrophota bacterium]
MAEAATYEMASRQAEGLRARLAIFETESIGYQREYVLANALKDEYALRIKKQSYEIDILKAEQVFRQDNLRRDEKLLEKNAVSVEEFESAKMACEVIAAKIEAATKYKERLEVEMVMLVAQRIPALERMLEMIKKMQEKYNADIARIEKKMGELKKSEAGKQIVPEAGSAYLALAQSGFAGRDLMTLESQAFNNRLEGSLVSYKKTALEKEMARLTFELNALEARRVESEKNAGRYGRLSTTGAASIVKAKQMETGAKKAELAIKSLQQNIEIIKIHLQTINQEMPLIEKEGLELAKQIAAEEKSLNLEKAQIPPAAKAESAAPYFISIDAAVANLKWVDDYLPAATKEEKAVREGLKQSMAELLFMANPEQLASLVPFFMDADGSVKTDAQREHDKQLFSVLGNLGFLRGVLSGNGFYSGRGMVDGVKISIAIDLITKNSASDWVRLKLFKTDGTAYGASEKEMDETKSKLSQIFNKAADINRGLIAEKTESVKASGIAMALALKPDGLAEWIAKGMFDKELAEKGIYKLTAKGIEALEKASALKKAFMSSGLMLAAEAEGMAMGIAQNEEDLPRWLKMGFLAVDGREYILTEKGRHLIWTFKKLDPLKRFLDGDEYYKSGVLMGMAIGIVDKPSDWAVFLPANDFASNKFEINDANFAKLFAIEKVLRSSGIAALEMPASITSIEEKKEASERESRRMAIAMDLVREKEDSVWAQYFNLDGTVKGDEKQQVVNREDVQAVFDIVADKPGKYYSDAKIDDAVEAFTGMKKEYITDGDRTNVALKIILPLLKKHAPPQIEQPKKEEKQIEKPAEKAAPEKPAEGAMIPYAPAQFVAYALPTEDVGRDADAEYKNLRKNYMEAADAYTKNELGPRQSLVYLDRMIEIAGEMRKLSAAENLKEMAAKLETIRQDVIRDVAKENDITVITQPEKGIAFKQLTPEAYTANLSLYDRYSKNGDYDRASECLADMVMVADSFARKGNAEWAKVFNQLTEGPASPAQTMAAAYKTSDPAKYAAVKSVYDRVVAAYNESNASYEQAVKDGDFAKAAHFAKICAYHLEFLIYTEGALKIDPRLQTWAVAWRAKADAQSEKAGISKTPEESSKKVLVDKYTKESALYSKYIAVKDYDMAVEHWDNMIDIAQDLANSRYEEWKYTASHLRIGRKKIIDAYKADKPADYANMKERYDALKRRFSEHDYGYINATRRKDAQFKDSVYLEGAVKYASLCIIDLRELAAIGGSKYYPELRERLRSWESHRAFWSRRLDDGISEKAVTEKQEVRRAAAKPSVFKAGVNEVEKAAKEYTQKEVESLAKEITPKVIEFFKKNNVTFTQKEVETLAGYFATYGLVHNLTPTDIGEYLDLLHSQRKKIDSFRDDVTKKDSESEKKLRFANPWVKNVSVYRVDKMEAVERILVKFGISINDLGLYSFFARLRLNVASARKLGIKAQLMGKFFDRFLANTADMDLFIDSYLARMRDSAELMGKYFGRRMNFNDPFDAGFIVQGVAYLSDTSKSVSEIGNDPAELEKMYSFAKEMYRETVYIIDVVEMEKLGESNDAIMLNMVFGTDASKNPEFGETVFAHRNPEYDQMLEGLFSNEEVAELNKLATATMPKNIMDAMRLMCMQLYGRNFVFSHTYDQPIMESWLRFAYLRTMSLHDLKKHIGRMLSVKDIVDARYKGLDIDKDISDEQLGGYMEFLKARIAKTGEKGVYEDYLGRTRKENKEIIDIGRLSYWAEFIDAFNLTPAQLKELFTIADNIEKESGQIKMLSGKDKFAEGRRMAIAMDLLKNG